MKLYFESKEDSNDIKVFYSVVDKKPPLNGAPIKLYKDRLDFEDSYVSIGDIKYPSIYKREPGAYYRRPKDSIIYFDSSNDESNILNIEDKSDRFVIKVSGTFDFIDNAFFDRHGSGTYIGTVEIYKDKTAEYAFTKTDDYYSEYYSDVRKLPIQYINLKLKFDKNLKFDDDAPVDNLVNNSGLIEISGETGVSHGGVRFNRGHVMYRAYDKGENEYDLIPSWK